jgi:Spy/CpxP family protein refolding chaperone
MKKSSLFILLIILSLSIVSCRKDRNDDGYYWGHGFGMGYGAGCFDERSDMMGQLGLQGADADKIVSIDEKYRKMYFDNRGNYDKINSLRMKHREEIESILGPVQKKKFDDIYSKRWGAWGHGYGRRHMGNYYGHGYGMGFGSGCWNSRESMTDYLKLTPDQSDKILEIDKNYSELYYRNRDDFNKIDDLRVKHRKEIEKVLTPEQREKFSQVYDNRWRGWGHMGGMGPGMMGY